MTSYLTRGAPYAADPDNTPDYVIMPDLVLSYESTRSARHVFHDVFGAPAPAVSLREFSSRTGTLELFFLDEAYSLQAEAFLRVPGRYYLTADVASMDLAFIPSDKLTRTLDPATRKRWILRVDYREVSA